MQRKPISLSDKFPAETLFRLATEKERFAHKKIGQLERYAPNDIFLSLQSISVRTETLRGAAACPGRTLAISVGDPGGITPYL